MTLHATLIKTKKYLYMNAQKFKNIHDPKSLKFFFYKGNNLKEVKSTCYHDPEDHKLLFRPSYVFWTEMKVRISNEDALSKWKLGDP